jgi:hypothetical protein
MIKILFPFLENLIRGYISLYEIIIPYGFVLIQLSMIFASLTIFNISRDFSSPKKIKNNIILSVLYLAFQSFMLGSLIMMISTSENIYFYLKNLINIKLIPLDNKFIVIYTSTIFLFFILTIIIVPIILIYSYINKIASFINTKYNLQIILTLIIFGIIGIIYLMLLNNLRYLNIINLIDAYFIFLFLAILGMVYIIFIIDRYYYYIINSPSYYDNLFKKNIKEINVKMIKKDVLTILITPSLFLVLLTFGFGLPLITIGFIPWYVIIFLVFYLYIIFEIIMKRYFSNKEKFYQDISKLNKYFNKRLLIIFGILAYVAIFDSLNLFLLKNFTAQIILQPIIIERNLLFQASLVFLANNIVCFLFYYFLYCHNYYLQHIPRYIYNNLATNIGYKVKNSYGIKNIQVNPIITLLSYLALFIVFLINLML